ncbi:outer membrane protein transport protein [Gemmobacter fulvus]|uniref:Outer membrane protein transport protein n=1 Tax=Gemmobacter fulvus TaxID=2840474 RepID=A0A975P7C0_9RHOB|nr:outer membrane protein transport protein [Gemmobacter fulvus]MBT9245181.1 outer membrane protein transport protein [Gemmobacter fulvus]MDQ1848049.1 outer membrane protein transport protein [Gemmobacter fulvus]QWK90483.1 outer membrane protein transport protein [Gemmobacter fulvus]
MKQLTALCGVLAAMAGTAQAGGIDRSGQPIGILFEKGNYVELSYGRINPSVSGVDRAIGPIPAGSPSGEVAGDHNLPGLALKYQFSDQLSAAVIYDQAYGADILYAPTSPALGGTYADVESAGLTALLRYQFNENFSVHGGLRASKASGKVGLKGLAYGLPFDPANPDSYRSVNGYEADLAEDWGTGYVLGVAYEKPEIAMRVALTYFSKVRHKFDTVETLPGGAAAQLGVATIDTFTNVDTPQAVNLDFQTGVAKDTLVFGSIRWVDWSDFRIAPDAFFGPTVGSLTDLEDTTTYTLGVGRKFNENWSGSAFLTYEPGTGKLVSPLAPTDGYRGIGLAAVYTQGNMKVTTGIRYLKLGNATPETGTPDTERADFTGNSAVAVGVKVGFTF